ncbi:36910_t:CDS:2 [Gigaspora margarita]|uniref:36910_t:CDS:1 n=1 Tax=Gigaspora margarita TaxID=4874 RepID=A0ABM8VYP5_GIGMA|nr:36910_t:CDS:2 [Gigaspora margarita]
MANCEQDLARLLVDKNAHRPKAPSEYEGREFYGQVLFYLHTNMKVKLPLFHNIDRCVGFLKIAENKYLIIDREHLVTFR